MFAIGCFEQDLKQVTINHLDILAREFVDEDVSQFKVCATCFLSLNKQEIPALSRSNGFVYPPYPTDLWNIYIPNLIIRCIYVKTSGTVVPLSLFYNHYYCLVMFISTVFLYLFHLPVTFSKQISVHLSNNLLLHLSFAITERFIAF
jgi:hypothetical protein